MGHNDPGGRDEKWPSGQKAPSLQRKIGTFSLMDHGGWHLPSHGQPPLSSSVGMETGPVRGWPERGCWPVSKLRLGAAPWKRNPKSKIPLRPTCCLVSPRAILHLLFCALSMYLQVLIEQTLAGAQ